MTASIMNMVQLLRVNPNDSRRAASHAIPDGHYPVTPDLSNVMPLTPCRPRGHPYSFWIKALSPAGRIVHRFRQVVRGRLLSKQWRPQAEGALSISPSRCPRVSSRRMTDAYQQILA